MRYKTHRETGDEKEEWDGKYWKSRELEKRIIETAVQSQERFGTSSGRVYRKGK